MREPPEVERVETEPLDLERVETERMVGERLTLGHADELCRLMLDAAVVPTTWPFAHPPTPEDVVAGLRDKVAHWERYGFGVWLMRDRASGEVVGRGGLQHTYTPGLNAIEATWVIAPARWGHGLGTELARAQLDAAFERLRVLAVVALTLADNVASRRVMEKTGFTYERDIVHAGLPHVLYGVRADGRRPQGFRPTR